MAQIKNWKPGKGDDSIRIYTDFTSSVSRKEVCVLNEGHPQYEFNKGLIKNAPDMLFLLEALLPDLISQQEVNKQELSGRNWSNDIKRIEEIVAEIKNYTK